MLSLLKNHKNLTQIKSAVYELQLEINLHENEIVQWRCVASAPEVATTKSDKLESRSAFITPPNDARGQHIKI